VQQVNININIINMCVVHFLGFPLARPSSKSASACPGNPQRPVWLLGKVLLGTAGSAAALSVSSANGCNGHAIDRETHGKSEW